VKILSRGRDVTGLPESFNVLGQGSVLGVQIPIIVSLVLPIFQLSAAIR
jgi:ribose/xylose/arabinose/galactoside ABC-type transport system permease subunit